MQLSLEECSIFYKLHPALMFYGNQKLQMIPDEPASPAEYASLESEKRVQFWDAVQSHPELIDQFVADNPPVPDTV